MTTPRLSYRLLWSEIYLCARLSRPEGIMVLNIRSISTRRELSGQSKVRLARHRWPVRVSWSWFYHQLSDRSRWTVQVQERHGSWGPAVVSRMIEELIAEVLGQALADPQFQRLLFAGYLGQWVRGASAALIWPRLQHYWRSPDPALTTALLEAWHDAYQQGQALAMFLPGLAGARDHAFERLAQAAQASDLPALVAAIALYLGMNRGHDMTPVAILPGTGEGD